MTSDSVSFPPDLIDAMRSAETVHTIQSVGAVVIVCKCGEEMFPPEHERHVLTAMLAAGLSWEPTCTTCGGDGLGTVASGDCWPGWKLGGECPDCNGSGTDRSAPRLRLVRQVGHHDFGLAIADGMEWSDPDVSLGVFYVAVPVPEPEGETNNG